VSQWNNKSLSSVTRARVFSAFCYYSIIYYTYKHTCLLLKNHIVQFTDTQDGTSKQNMAARLLRTSWVQLPKWHVLIAHGEIFWLSSWCLVSEHSTASAEWKCNFLERSSFGLRHPQAHKNEGHGTHGSIDSKSSSIAPAQHQACRHSNGPCSQPVCKGGNTSSKTLNTNRKNLTEHKVNT